MIPSRQRFARAVHSFIAERKRIEGTMDIVKKLRVVEHITACKEAADEIERLRAAMASAIKECERDMDRVSMSSEAFGKLYAAYINDEQSTDQ